MKWVRMTSVICSCRFEFDFDNPHCCTVVVIKTRRATIAQLDKIFSEVSFEFSLQEQFYEISEDICWISWLVPVCCKKQQKKVPDRFLVCVIGDLWRTWMIPNWFYLSPSDFPDHPGSILYHSELFLLFLTANRH